MPAEWLRQHEMLGLPAIAFHTTSTMPASRCRGQCCSLSHALSKTALVPMLIGKPNTAAGVDTGSRTGASKRVPGLLALPFGGKTGALRRTLPAMAAGHGNRWRMNFQHVGQRHNAGAFPLEIGGTVRPRRAGKSGRDRSVHPQNDGSCQENGKEDFGFGD